MMLDFYRLLAGAQGTMGIVTWASLRCEIQPEVHRSYLVPSHRLGDLIEFAYGVLRPRFGEELFLMNAAQLAALTGASLDTLPPWVCAVGIAGREILPEARVAYQEKDIAGIAQQHGLRPVPAIGNLSGEAVVAKAASTCGEASWKEGTAGGFQDIFFSTTLDKTAEFAAAMADLASGQGYRRPVGVYIQPENMGTSCHLSFTLPYDHTSAAETKCVRALFEAASETFSRMGAYYFRPYGLWSRLQLNKDAQSYKVLEKLRGIFDPNGVLNPGKLRNN
jgi:FAD/FMN-containing dehydrogenase